MNAGIVTSFVIGALLLLAILAMQLNLSASSTDLTMEQITQQNAETISTLIAHDIPKIAYNQFGAVPGAIITAEAHHLAFKSNIDNSSDESVEIVEWIYDTSTSVDVGSNPNDYMLTRIVGGVKTELSFGVTRFSFTYLDKDQNITSVPSEIRYIKVIFTLQSREKVGVPGPGDGSYVQTVWHKMFIPKNLQL